MRDIEEIRKQLNLTQAEMAQMLGMSFRSYCSRIAGEQEWKLGHLITVADHSDGEIAIRHGQHDYIISIKKVA